eukprot:5689604-Amphidinium_carterae.2
MGLSMRGPCEEARSETPTELLMDDLIGGSGGCSVAHLCWRHATQYKKERACSRCPMVGCKRAGTWFCCSLGLCCAQNLLFGSDVLGCHGRREHRSS